MNEVDITVSREGSRTAIPRRPSGRLVSVFPPEVGRVVFALGDQPLTIGRVEDAGVRGLPHPTVSRRHLAVEPSGGGFAARDLGSHNGSALGGMELGARAQAIADGDVLRIGDALLVVEIGAAADDPEPADVDLAELPGESWAMRRARRAIARAAPDRAPVLVLGETGVGKERVAAELHRLSKLRGPLVAVNCATLGRELIESQLFGHVRGAFTGAGEAQPGLFVAAHGGTLFLDEIGELPLDLQPKLLRALQEEEVRPVGGTRVTRVDVRVVAATNRDLARKVDAEEFRRDLYARLALWEIVIPPLRARRADVLDWVHRMHGDWRRAHGAAPRTLRLRADAAEAILLASWPENLRGIDRLAHALDLSEDAGVVGRAELPSWLVGAPAAEPPAVQERAGRQAAPTPQELEAFLIANGGSIHAAARHFRRDRRQIYRWLDAYGLRDRMRDLKK